MQGPALRALLGWALWVAAHAALAATPVAPVPVRVDSLQATRAEDATRLRAWWYPLVAARPAPAVVLLHGCGGMLNARGEPSAKTREYADLLKQTLQDTTDQEPIVGLTQQQPADGTAVVLLPPPPSDPS